MNTITERYKYQELQHMLNEDEPTLLAAIKELNIGNKADSIITYELHEIQKLKLYLNQRDRIDYLKIIEHLDKLQPIKIYPLQLALEEEGLYYRIPILIDKYTYKDKLLWEDKVGNLWYDFDEWFEEYNLYRVAEEFSESHVVINSNIWW